MDDRVAQLRELVRLATLAPSSHNTQCWRFRLHEPEGSGEDIISILPDRSRRCPIVDPDDHHLHVSLGCAAENLMLAARAVGRQPALSVSGPGEEDAIRIRLAPPGAASSSADGPVPGDGEDPLVAAIPERQCTRAEYDGTAVANDDLRRLEGAAASSGGARIVLLTAANDIERVLEFVTAGNRSQLRDPAFVRELETWIRFSEREAEATGDGLSSRASGNPSLPRWLGRAAFRLTLSARRMNDQYARQVRSSAALAVIVSDADDFAHRVEAGRVYERFALMATSMGLRNAFVNQPVEVARLRPQLVTALGLGPPRVRPNLIVRLGRGPTMPRSHRRPIDEVIVD